MPSFFKRKYMRKSLKSATEVWVGVAVLLISTGIAAALVIHTRYFEAKQLFDVDPSYLKRAEPEELAAVDLPELDLADWSEPRGVRTFSPDTLYEKIDGRADLYLQYNFKQLTFAKYIKNNDPDQDIQVWLYDMTSPENAEGIFLSERSGEVHDVPLGRAGYSAGASYFFWKGPMYVSVIAIDEAFSEQSLLVAQKLADSIEDVKQRPWAEDALPEQDLVADSRAYLASSAFSLDFLNEVYTATYTRIDGDFSGEITLFIHQAADPVEAAAVLEKYVSFFKDYGEVVSENDGIVVGDGGGVIDAVFVSGRYLAGVSEAPSAAVAASQAAWFKQHLDAVGDKLP